VQRLLEGFALLDQPAGMPEKQQNQHGRGYNIHDGQDFFDGAGAFAEDFGKLVGTDREPAVKLIELRRQQPHSGLVGENPALYLKLDVVAELGQLQQHWVGVDPLLDRDLQITYCPKIAIQPYQARDVGRMIPALQKALARRRPVALFHRPARVEITERNGEPRLVLIEVLLLSGPQVEVEEVNGVLLPSRPE
jgi:hypothetical protein